jgi:hypothetical protein
MGGVMTTATTPAAHIGSPELRLLLAIARADWDAGEQESRRNLLFQPLDWDYLVALAIRHGVEPLLALYLERHATAPTPPWVMEALRQECRTIARRNLVLAAALLRISAHLRSLKIEHIWYKGPLLAQVCYGDCSLRVARDLDIVVPEQKLEAARDALGEIGFTDQYGLTAAQQAVSFRLGFEHPFTAAGGLDLDLHWRVVQKFKSRSLDMAGIWRRVTMVRFMDGEAPTFCPEDTLVALALHCGHHGWTQLSHFCDIAQLLRVHPRLDWDIVCGHLGDSNSARLVYLCLHLVHRHWQATLPEEMKARISSDSHVARLADRVETEIWPSLEPVLTTSNLRWFLDRSAGLSAGDRMHLLAGSIFCPAIEDFQAFRLPPMLSPLYYALRPLRLVCQSAFA